MITHITLALTPFWNAQTSFWPSAAVTSTSKLGYSYPEFNGLDTSNTDATRTAIGNIVNRLYGSGGRGVAGSFAAVPQSIPAPVSADTAKKVPAAAASSSHTRSLAAVPASHNPSPPQQHPTDQQPMSIQVHPSAHPTASSHHDVWDWTARVEFKKYELGSSFTVLIFLGQVPENPREWRISPNYVGGQHAFVNSSAGRCANCTSQQDLVVEGFVHLNNAIAQHSGLGSLDPDVIKPYLTHNLHWRVQKVLCSYLFYVLRMPAHYYLRRTER